MPACAMTLPSTDAPMRAVGTALVLKADLRPGHTGQLAAEVERLEELLRDGRLRREVR